MNLPCGFRIKEDHPMRRLKAAGVSVLLSVGGLTAQESVPAAKLGRIRPIDGRETSRAQGGATPMIPPGGTPLVPPPLGTPLQPMPMGGTTSLPPAKPFPNPTVVVEPGTPQPGIAAPPAATFSMPAPTMNYAYPPGAIPMSGPMMVGPPSVQPMVYPYSPGTALTGEAAPSLQPTMPAPQMDRPLFGGIGGPMALLTAPSRWELSADYLLWWVKSQDVPALVTTSSPQFNGIIGNGDTRIIFGNDRLGNTLHGGGRFSAVRWFDDSRRWGLDGSVFFLGRNGSEFISNTAENPLLARPFLNLNQAIPFAEIIGAPGLAVGAVSVINNTQLWGADINLRRAFLCGNCAKLDLLLGYKYMRLTDDITITESFRRTGAVGPPDALFGSVSDRFETQNNFHGVNMGVAGEVRRGRWFLEGRATVALGTVFQTLTISGNQQIQFADGPRSAAGGLLALPGGNIGTYHQNQFAVVPEIGMKVGMNITNNLRLGVGYNFLYLSNVLRAGDTIDTGLDVTRIPNFPVPGNPPPLASPRPLPQLRTTDIFAQGVSFSVQYTW